RAKCVDVGQADQLARLGTVTDVVAPAVDEQIGRGAVDELESLPGDRLPVRGGDALSHDAAGDRYELVVDVGDPLGVYATPNLFDELLTALLGDEALEIGHLCPPPQASTRTGMFLSSELCMLR